MSTCLQQNKLTHDSCECDFCGFSNADKPPIKPLHIWIVSCRHDGWHIKRIPQMFAAALYERFAAPLACLFTHRKRQDPKARLFMDYTIKRIGDIVRTTAP